MEGARITSLWLIDVKMSHHSSEQLGEYLSSCSSLQIVYLNKVTCSEHRDGCCCLVLDLQKHNKLEKLELHALCVEGLLLPFEGAKITSLALYNVTMNHHSLEQLLKYVSSQFYRLVGVKCYEHRDSSCKPFKDLRDHFWRL